MSEFNEQVERLASAAVVARAQGRLGPEEIEHRFGFHKATVEGENATLPRHSELRLDFREFVEHLDSILPAGRAKDVAMQQLEDASMWAHKAIAEKSPLIEEGSTNG
jgi:hypothetical protein